MIIASILGAAALLSPVLAQTFTNCDPLNKTCPADPALGLNYTFYFNSSTEVNQVFNLSGGGTPTYGSEGIEFTVAEKGDSPTIISQFYIFWGSVSVIMKAATGQGIISSIVLLSDDLDEVDWEFMGGNATYAETNYFGKNDTAGDRAIYYPVSSDLRENFHNYTTHWTSEQLQWYIDGQLVRTLLYADASNGTRYPQTPMTVRMGIWAGGDSDEPPGTIEWAGGVTDYSKGPFTMVVQSATVNDFSVGKQYVYTDNSGDWQSIDTVAGNATAATTLLAPVPLTLAQKWANLPSGTKLAIYCSAGAAGALLFSAMLFTCIRQRRKGRQERDAYNAKVEQEREEAYKDQIQLREKGLGGWDNKEFASQGDDALGGWGGTHVVDGAEVPRGADSSPIKSPAVASLNQVPSRSNTPGFRSNTPGYGNNPPQYGNNTPGYGNNTPGYGNNTPGYGSNTPSFRSNTPGAARTMSPAPSRMISPSPNLVAPQPQRTWNGAPQGAMNPGITSYGSSRNIPQSPNFPPISPQGRGPSRGGYQRF